MKTRRQGEMPVVLSSGVFLFFLLVGFCLAQANPAEAAIANHAVVNEVSIESAVGLGGTNDDWVELFNPTAQTITLNGWSIQKTAGSGSSLVREPLSGSILPGGYFLIVRNNASTTQALKDKADVLAGDNFSLASNNIVYLVNDNNNITGSTDPNIVDFVGWGTAVYYEGSTAAPAVTAGKSITRSPNGEDTNQNSVDFILETSPTPTNSSASGSDDIGGTVLATITPDATPVIDITSTGAKIVFQVNSAGSGLVKYGLDNTYSSSTAPVAIQANVTKTISLSGLACAKVYHYAIYAENAGASDSDQTSDAVFTTLPCGIKIDSLTMTKSTAKANNNYTDGWQWEFNITVWDLNEASLKMKFNQWSGAGFLDAGANMQYSVDSSTWQEITDNGAYPAVSADISAIDNSLNPGRQVKIIVKMKVPVGTSAGYYNSNYGILTE
jgi:hypothetical protein